MKLQCFLVLILEYILLDVRGVLAVQNPKRLFRGGRHVCMQQMQKAHPVPVRQSYWRSVHTQVQEPCSNGYGLCPRFRVTYQRAFRTVFRMRISVHLVPQCCPGWEQESTHDRGCIKPICEGGCATGTCTGPNTCTCREGWEGLHCEKDVDECEKAHGCSQECMNQQGSYECACSEGFILQPDMRSCKFCMSCTKEYREMQDTIVSLNRKVRSIETVKVTTNGEHRAMQDMASSIVELTHKVTTLEKEKNMLMGNVTHLEKNYKNAMVVMDEIKSKPVAPPTTTKAYNSNPYAANPDEMPFDRIASLSEQISLLEERLEGCTCKDYDDYGRQRDSIRG